MGLTISYHDEREPLNLPIPYGEQSGVSALHLRASEMAESRLDEAASASLMGLAELFLHSLSHRKISCLPSSWSNDMC